VGAGRAAKILLWEIEYRITFFLMDAPLDLSLTHGQVAWVLSRGMPPSRELHDQLRYLRQLGVPFTKYELGMGSGNRIRYGFDHLIELGVALFGLRRGMAPREVAGILVNHRDELRQCYRDTLAALPAQAFEAEWVKSRGALVPIMGEERFIRMHDRYSQKPGTFDVVQGGGFASLMQLNMITEKYPGEEVRMLLPLSRLVLELLAWAREAPEIKPGRK
jgi:hypothetical protein